jgi:hypothetical protein
MLDGRGQVKIFVNLDLFLTNCIINLVEGFRQKKFSLTIFQSKKEHQPVCGGILCIPSGWESYMTPRRLTGVRQGAWGVLA